MKRSSLSVLPKGIREDVEGVFRPDTEEIRVRANRPVQLRGPQSILLNRIASPESAKPCWSWYALIRSLPTSRSCAAAM